jgi:hypothetical protein
VAVYMSAARKRRRTAVVAVVAVLVGLVLGVIIGRATGGEDPVGDSRRDGREVAAALRTLPVEYELLRSGAPGKSQAALQDAVDRIADDLFVALAHASWLGPTARAQATDSMKDAQRAVGAAEDPTEFGNDIEKAASSIEDVFNVAGEP